MARILYGVHGTGHGHAIRALAVARHYPQHEFLMVSHGDGAELLRPHFPLHECRNPATPVAAHRVQGWAALGDAACQLARGPAVLRRLRQAGEAFAPDAVITDYELFTPLVARALRLPSLSLDNQHALVFGRVPFPLTQWVTRIFTLLSVRLLFSQADEYLVSCFYPRSGRASRRVQWVPPLLRDAVLAQTPTDGDHVIAYQGYSTFPGFVDTLRTLSRPVHVYGLGERPAAGNLVFKTFSETSFLADLAGCACVVCGGGHTLISEALHLGKPVFSIPIRGAFEQFVNAYELARAGYGAWTTASGFSPARLAAFERELDLYRAHLAGAVFNGNPAVFAALDRFIVKRR